SEALDTARQGPRDRRCRPLHPAWWDTANGSSTAAGKHRSSLSLHEPREALGQIRVAYATWICPIGFKVPMRAKNGVEAFHQPTHPGPFPGGESAFVRVLSDPILGGIRADS